MQTERDESALKEGEHAHAQGAGGCHEALEGTDAVLDMGPAEAGKEGNREHHEERDDVDEGGTGKDAQPFGQFDLVELVVDGNHDAGDSESADHAHVERLDRGDHGKSGRSAHLGGEVDTEEAAPLREQRAHEVLEREVAHKSFHAATSVLLIGEANGKRHGE